MRELARITDRGGRVGAVAVEDARAAARAAAIAAHAGRDGRVDAARVAARCAAPQAVDRTHIAIITAPRARARSALAALARLKRVVAAGGRQAGVLVHAARVAGLRAALQPLIGTRVAIITGLRAISIAALARVHHAISASRRIWRDVGGRALIREVLRHIQINDQDRRRFGLRIWAAAQRDHKQERGESPHLNSPLIGGSR